MFVSRKRGASGRGGSAFPNMQKGVQKAPRPRGEEKFLDNVTQPKIRLIEP